MARERQPIAITGMDCRFPGASTPESFWRMLRAGRDGIRPIPPTRYRAEDVASVAGQPLPRRAGLLAEIDRFDREAFGISAHEAARMDPQQRMLLEVAASALRRAGHSRAEVAGSDTAVFVGFSNSDYGRRLYHSCRDVDSAVAIGNAASIAANRISYVLDLRGPSLVVDTACSSSLAAVHLAVRSLRDGECELALAGGVNLLLGPELDVAFTHAGMMAADGRCKTFDAAADGYVRGEGCGLVVLKLLADAEAGDDPIIGILRGSAMGQDGRSNGITAPRPSAQKDVIRRALADGAVAPADIDYVELHGTGTQRGDPIEFVALKGVFAPRAGRRGCALGSVKTNIGHLEAAAGVAGLIKVLLALRYGAIPPHLNLRRLSSRIDLAGTPFSVPVELTPWRPGDRVRRAGVSSFGFGGTNVHVVVEEAPVAGQ